MEAKLLLMWTLLQQRRCNEMMRKIAETGLNGNEMINGFFPFAPFGLRQWKT